MEDVYLELTSTFIMTTVPRDRYRKTEMSGLAGCGADVSNSRFENALTVSIATNSTIQGPV